MVTTRLLRVLICIGAVAPLVVVVTTESQIPDTTRVEAAVLWVLCLAPSVIYLSKLPHERRPVPFIQGVGLLYGLYFALPVALGAHGKSRRVFLDPEVGFNEPTFLALVGWIILLASYAFFKMLFDSQSGERRFPEQFTLPPEAVRRWGVLLLVGGMVADITRRTLPVPTVVAGIARFSYALFWLGAGLLIVLAMKGRLHKKDKLLLVSGLLIMGVVQLTTGLTSGLVRLGMVVLLSAWVAKRHLTWRWVPALLISIALVMSVRGVIDTYRFQVWGAGGSFVERAEIMTGLLASKIQIGGVWYVVSDGGDKIAGRSAYAEVFADVVQRTPEQVPYWRGETYYSLIGIAVPRALWPDKPEKKTGQAFGHRYGYLDPWDRSTSMNMPWLIEFYANFGSFGVFSGMAVVGIIYALLQAVLNKPGQKLERTMLGIVLLISLLNLESSFSLTFGGLILNGVAVWLVVKAMYRYPFLGIMPPATAASSN